MRKILIAALLVIPAAAPMPVLAQANDRILMIYGDDVCPKDTICVRGTENERYRIPKQLRDIGPIAPGNQSWAARAQSVTDAGASSGIGSCTPIGPGGGWTGCYMERMRAARAEAKANGEAAPVITP